MFMAIFFSSRNMKLSELTGNSQDICVLSLTGSQQSGAAEACWAHNPEVDGSKPSSATYASIAQ